MKTWQFILILVVLCGIGVLLLLFFLGYVLKIPSKEVRIEVASIPVPMNRPAIDLNRDTIIGNARALVTIVAYMDFACSHCATMFTRLNAFLTRSPDTLRLVWKDVPRFAQQGVSDAHIAARCAYEQNKFIEYSGALYRGQPNFSQQQLRSYATMMGLNLPRFTACQERQDHTTRFTATKDEANALGLTGTPTLFIDDERIDGEISIEKLDEIIGMKLRKEKL